MIQWLRLCASNAGGIGSIPGQRVRVRERRAHMLHVQKKKKKVWGLQEEQAWSTVALEIPGPLEWEPGAVCGGGGDMKGPPEEGV